MNRRLGYLFAAFALTGMLAGCGGTNQTAGQSRTAGDTIQDAAMTVRG